MYKQGSIHTYILSLSLALCVYIYLYLLMYLLFTVQLCIYIYVHRYLVYIYIYIHGQIHFSEYGDEHMFIQTVFLDSSCPNSNMFEVQISSLILSDIPKTYHLFGYLFYLASSCLHLPSRTWWNFNPRSLDRHWSPPSPRDKAKGIPASACLR